MSIFGGLHPQGFPLTLSYSYSKVNIGYFFTATLRVPLHNASKFCHHFLNQHYPRVNSLLVVSSIAVIITGSSTVSMLVSPREISGKEFLADVKAGTDDVGLMTKYEITRRQLKALLRQLAEAGALDPMERLTLEINSKDFISDVRSGILDAQLMERYQLSRDELNAVCARLAAKGALSQEELDSRNAENEP